MSSETVKDLWNGKSPIFCPFQRNGTRNDPSFLVPQTLADIAVPMERIAKERCHSKHRSVPLLFYRGTAERNERFRALQTRAGNWGWRQVIGMSDSPSPARESYCNRSQIDVPSALMAVGIHI